MGKYKVESNLFLGGMLTSRMIESNPFFSVEGAQLTAELFDNLGRNFFDNPYTAKARVPVRIFSTHEMEHIISDPKIESEGGVLGINEKVLKLGRVKLSFVEPYYRPLGDRNNEDFIKIVRGAKSRRSIGDRIQSVAFKVFRIRLKDKRYSIS